MIIIEIDGLEEEMGGAEFNRGGETVVVVKRGEDGAEDLVGEHTLFDPWPEL